MGLIQSYVDMLVGSLVWEAIHHDVLGEGPIDSTHPFLQWCFNHSNCISVGSLNLRFQVEVDREVGVRTA